MKGNSHKKHNTTFKTDTIRFISIFKKNIN